jgi:hypothetical protein
MEFAVIRPTSYCGNFPHKQGKIGKTVCNARAPDSNGKPAGKAIDRASIFEALPGGLDEDLQ